MEETVKRVIIRGFEMPECCGECEFEGIPDGYDDDDIPVDECAVPMDTGLPFCILNNENISDDSVRAAHCWLKEVEVLVRRHGRSCVDKLTSREEHHGISDGSASFLVRDESLIDMDSDFWSYLEKEGFRPWGVHGHWNTDWVYINVNSMTYAPGMPGIKITDTVASTGTASSVSISDFKTIWRILKGVKKELP